jgi:hypothetical protein
MMPWLYSGRSATSPAFAQAGFHGQDRRGQCGGQQDPCERRQAEDGPSVSTRRAATNASVIAEH